MNTKLEWSEVTLSQNNQEVPIKRWGHKFVSIDNEFIMFGGFGADMNHGRYLNDLWVFDSNISKWSKVITENAPSARSNYTFNVNYGTRQIILFGGGAQNKTRFNSIYILNWDSKVWKQIKINEAQQRPWERTYHVAEFKYPYLIVHGGQGVSNMDLDDLWVYNFIEKKWKQIKIAEQSIKPSKRRFHCSSMLNNFLYITGGCYDNYVMCGDIFRIDLSLLFEKGQTQNYLWQRMVNQHPKLKRWGMSADVRQNNIYFFGGRAKEDFSDSYCYQSTTNQILEIEVNNKPKPRRRHSSVISGNCLVIFGGFEKDYLSDFQFLRLPQIEETIKNISVAVQKVETDQNVRNELKKKENKVKAKNRVTLLIEKQGKYCGKIKTEKQKLKNNKYFSFLMNQDRNKQITLQIPSFSSIISLKIALHCITHNTLLLSNNYSIDNYQELLKTVEYYCVDNVISLIDQKLTDFVDQLTYDYLLQLGIQFNLKKTKKVASQIYLKMKESLKDEEFEGQVRSHTVLMDVSPSQKPLARKKKEILNQTENQLQFSIKQQILKQKGVGIFGKAFKRIKSMLSTTSSLKDLKSQNNVNNSQESVQNQGCFSKLIKIFAEICSSKRVNAIVEN